MNDRWLNLCTLLCLASWFSGPGIVAAAQEAVRPVTRPVLEISKDTVLDPAKTYGPIVIKASNITIDGRGAWVIGATEGDPKDYKGMGVSAVGVSNVTLKNLNAKGWDIGLKVEHGSHWLVENCNFSDNFHYPEAGWGELGHHGGIVFEFVDHSTLRKNKANRVWDACMLANSDDNLVEENDFSHTSNTCLSLWTACRNRILKNNLSWGIRIKPGEVHARDSACVMVQAGSDDNYFADNDITHGGDGVFIRPYAGWTSSGNVFERNDASLRQQQLHRGPMPAQHLSPQQGEPWQPRHLGGMVERDDRRGQRGLLQRFAQRVPQRPVGIQVRAEGAAAGRGRHYHGRHVQPYGLPRQQVHRQ